MDIADEANDYAERLISHGISNRPAHLHGPVECVRCGCANDRRREGFGVCSDCVEGE